MPAYKTLTKSQTFAIEKKCLENAKEKFVLDQFSIKDMVPQKSGNQMIWHYYDHIDEDQVHVLVEGVTPSTTDLVRVPVSGTIKRRGTLMPITDELMEMHENSGELHKEMSNEMGYVIGRVLEKDAFNILMNGAGTVLPFTNVDADLKLVRQALRKSNAPKITSIKTGSTKIGTKPVAAGWYGFTSIDDADIFRAAADFMPVEDYGYTQDLIENEIGVIKSLGLRIVETEYVNDGSAVFIGEGAFASLGLSSKNRIEYIVKGLGEEGANDGLNQRGSSGAKTRSSTAVLRSDYVVKLATVTVSAYAGVDKTGSLNTAVNLNDAVLYGAPASSTWSVSHGPDGHAATFGDDAALVTTFTADVAGNYTVRLTPAGGEADELVITIS